MRDPVVSAMTGAKIDFSKSYVGKGEGEQEICRRWCLVWTQAVSSLVTLGELNKGKPQGSSSSNRRERWHWIAVVSGCGKKFTLLGKLTASVVKDSNSNKTTLSSPTMGC